MLPCMVIIDRKFTVYGNTRDSRLGLQHYGKPSGKWDGTHWKDQRPAMREEHRQSKAHLLCIYSTMYLL